MYKPDANLGDQARPQNVPSERSADQPLEDLAPGDTVGSFTGFLRRPKSSAQGLTAQVFGENGTDADVIAALHLTRFQDAKVKVNVWMLKNAQGKIMSKDGKPPLLAEFIGSIRRPAASTFGQTALFFGENGPNADAINTMNLTNVLDALVYVEIVKAGDGQTVADLAAKELSEEAKAQTARHTPAEARQLRAQQKTATEGWRLLKISGFFRKEALWSVLGREEAYKNWLEAQDCGHPGTSPCPNEPVVAYRVPTLGRYGFLSLCQEHADQWERGGGTGHGAQAPVAFLGSRQLSQVQQWAEEALRQALGTPAGFDPMPSAVYAWLMERSLHKEVPNTFLGLI